MQVLKVSNISRTYQASDNRLELIYRDASMHASKGEVTLISGASGSGKSTLLKQLALIDSTPSGSILLFDKATQKLSSSQRAKLRAEHIGFIFQSFALIEEFSILDNCALPLIMNGTPRKQAQRVAEQKLKQFLPDLNLLKKPCELSGGQQQRVAIIRAIIHKPAIIIADEPTGNLDNDNALKIKSTLKEMADQLGSAVIIVSHDLSFSEIANHHYELIASNDEQAKSTLRQVF